MAFRKRSKHFADSEGHTIHGADYGYVMNFNNNLLLFHGVPARGKVRPADKLQVKAARDPTC